MAKITDVFKALSDRNRFRIVAALMNNDELCACQVTELIQVAGATVSRHMSVLIASELVESRKEGRWVYYRLRREQARFKDLLSWIEAEMGDDSDAVADAEMLKSIMACDPEDLCRRQRGDGCC